MYSGIVEDAACRSKRLDGSVQSFADRAGTDSTHRFRKRALFFLPSKTKKLIDNHAIIYDKKGCAMRMSMPVCMCVPMYLCSYLKSAWKCLYVYVYMYVCVCVCVCVCAFDSMEICMWVGGCASAWSTWVCVAQFALCEKPLSSFAFSDCQAPDQKKGEARARKRKKNKKKTEKEDEGQKRKRRKNNKTKTKKNINEEKRKQDKEKKNGKKKSWKLLRDGRVASSAAPET